jgi:hypothetical protein
VACLCPRNRIECPYSAFDFLGRAPPVDLGFTPGYARSIGHSGRALRNGGRTRFERSHEQARPERGELVVQTAPGVLGRDGDRFLEQDRPGVEPFIHLHDGDASRPVTGEERALDRRGSAPARQERCVHVETAARREREQRRRQDQSIGRDNQRCGLCGSNGSQRLGIP